MGLEEGGASARFLALGFLSWCAIDETEKRRLAPILAVLNSDTPRPFAKPASGRIAVEVVRHLGDEVMKVYRINRLW